MRNDFVKKSMIFGIIVLLIGVGITQMVTGNKLIFDNSKSYNLESINGFRNIMLTGYWNPTGQMIAPFSNDTYLNPDGWKGSNWEGWGYNIYSFFPTPYLYNGTFEVDYQDTWEDFWNITDEIKPIAIISFGAGNGPWEIEYNARNLDTWIPDNKPPKQPTPCPPDNSVPPGYERHSTLPVQAIANAVNDQTSINAWIDWNGNPGAFLCEYMAYLGMWYQSLHNTSEDPYHCWAAGFIHVKNTITVEDAMGATNVTIREVIKYLLNVPAPPGAPIITGPKFGKAGKEYCWMFHSDDPNGDMIYYIIDWGDGTTTETECKEPCTLAEACHTFTEQKIYTIKIKAKKCTQEGLESDWSTITVTMPRTRIANRPFLQLFKNHLNLFPVLRLLKQCVVQ